MKFRATLLLSGLMVVVGAGQGNLAAAATHDARDLDVDRSIGGLEQGSRPLPPSPAAHRMPGAKPSPGDTGGLKPAGGAARAVGTAASSSGKAVGESRAPSGETGSGGTTTSTPTGGGGTGTSGGTTTSTPTGPIGGATGIESGVSGGGQPSEIGSQQPETGGGTVTEPQTGGGGGAETGGGTTTEPQAETGTETGQTSGLNVHLETDTSSGETSAGVSSGGEPIIETEVNNETGVGGTSVETSEPVAQTGLETETQTAETTVDTSTQTSDGNLTLDVSAGSDVSQTDLEGAGSKDDVDEEAIRADNDDCKLLNPLSLPEKCL